MKREEEQKSIKEAHEAIDRLRGSLKCSGSVTEMLSEERRMDDEKLEKKMLLFMTSGEKDK